MDPARHGRRVLHVGEGDAVAALGRRLDEAYDALMATTSRHFQQRGDGWRLSGVAGLDTPTMNRAAVRDAPPDAAPRVVADADAFFGERGVPWSVVLSSWRPGSDWHASLLGLGLTFSSQLDVLARDPVELPVEHELPVREVGEDELGLFTDLLIEVFHMPRRFYPALRDMSEAWQRHGATLYFGLDSPAKDAAPVATALLARTGSVAGIYNVGTRRGHRRHGYARALMARAFEDASDADVVTLQVAPGSIAEHFYLRMGFEPVHAWRFYTPGVRMPSLLARLTGQTGYH